MTDFIRNRDKISVHVLNIRSRLNEPVENYLKYFTQQRQEKILKYKFLPDRNRTIFAELLARVLISEFTGKSFKEIRIFRNENGKPYCNIEGIYFSLSHSGEWVACSLGNFQNGVDVETKNNNFELDIAKRFFLPKEYETLKALKDWRKKFLQYWTIKESCLKCYGLRDWSNVDCEEILKTCGCNFELYDGSVLGLCTEGTTSYDLQISDSVQFLQSGFLE